MHCIYLAVESSAVVPVGALDALHDVVVGAGAVNAAPEAEVAELHLVLEDDQRGLDGGALLRRQNHTSRQAIHVRRKVLEVQHLSSSSAGVNSRRSRHTANEFSVFLPDAFVTKTNFMFLFCGICACLICLLCVLCCVFISH